MSLFLVEHHHTAASCPAGNPEMVKALANHVSPANAAQFGVKILSDCVLQDEHTVYFAVEADGPDKVAAFAAPFINVGPTTIRPAITCEMVAARGRD